MTYLTDTQIDLTELKKSYIISSQHRKTGNVNKSLWSISNEEEVLCFVETIKQKWIDGANAWGVKVVNNALQKVGANNDGQTLKIARFVDSYSADVWHGYPADYIRKSNDRPTTNVLSDWVKKSYITKAKMAKIRQGQLCNL